MENARFEVLDFSASGGERELNVIDARNIPRIDDRRKTTMPSTFAEGFFQAEEELRGKPEEHAGDSPTDEMQDPDQPGFFDDP